MGFRRFVEVGRVCVVSFGKEEGKLCTILEVVDGNRVLVDGPRSLTGVSRKVMSLKHLMLTDIKVKLSRHARQKQLLKAWEKEGVQAKFEGSSWGKKIAARRAKAEMGDFERFQQQLEKKKLSAAIKARLGK